MLNQVILVGRVTSINEDGKFIVLEVSNRFSEEPDVIKCHLEGDIAEQSVKYVTIGTTIGAKARLRSKDEDKLEVVVEKLTFIKVNHE